MTGHRQAGAHLKLIQRTIPRNLWMLTAIVALVGSAAACQEEVGRETPPSPEVAVPVPPEAAAANVPTEPERIAAPAVKAAPPAQPAALPDDFWAARAAPDLLANVGGRVGPETARRLREASDAGRAFAQRSGVTGLRAQGVTDVFAQLALDVARVERAGLTGPARTVKIQKAARHAFDAVHTLVAESALSDAVRELSRWTGDVSVELPDIPTRQHVPLESLP